MCNFHTFFMDEVRIQVIAKEKLSLFLAYILIFFFFYDVMKDISKKLKRDISEIVYKLFF